MLAVLAACTLALGPLAMLKLYAVPYWINVMWLDAVTYLHHHGPESDEKVPWYRGQVRCRAAAALECSSSALLQPNVHTSHTT